MPAGRPSKLTPDLIRSIGNAVTAGLYRETASALQNISRETFHTWLKRGAREKQRLREVKGARPRKSEALFVELSDTVEKAIAAADLRDLAIIDKHAQGGLPEVTIVTRTRSRPVLDAAGNPIKTSEGQPVMVVETVTERREAATLPTWQAAAWKLERRNPREFGRRIYREPLGRDGDPLIAFEAVRAILAGTDELTREGWEELEDLGTLEIGATEVTKRLVAGDPSNPPPDLPEGDPPA